MLLIPAVLYLLRFFHIPRVVLRVPNLARLSAFPIVWAIIVRDISRLNTDLLLFVGKYGLELSVPELSFYVLRKPIDLSFAILGYIIGIKTH